VEKLSVFIRIIDFLYVLITTHAKFHS